MSATDLSFGLYISGGDETLRARQGHLRVELDGGHRDFPLENIDSVLVGAGARISGPAVALLREQGVAVSFMDWVGRLQGRLEPHPSRNALMRRAQVLAAEDPERCMALARAMVVGKLHNQRVWLQRAARRRQIEEVEGALHALSMAGQLAAEAPDRATLMGHEGSGARAWFGVWGALLDDSPFEWRGRRKHPSTDPINALLSFGYAVLTARCADAASAAGLDPYVGFLHAERQGRAELALDLVEEFRTPIIDALVLGLIGRRQLTPEHFSTELDGSCRLSQSARKIFFEAFSEKLRTVQLHPFTGRKHPLSHFPILQARLLGQHCQGRLPRYVPCTWR